MDRVTSLREGESIRLLPPLYGLTPHGGLGSVFVAVLSLRAYTSNTHDCKLLPFSKVGYSRKRQENELRLVFGLACSLLNS